MAWIWDIHESAWGHDKTSRDEDRDPLNRFLVHVDVMLYVAMGALVVCLATLLLR